MRDMYFVASDRVTDQREIRHSAQGYINAQPFLRKVRRMYLNGQITYDQIKTIREMALKGDMHGAAMELYRIRGGAR